MKRFLRHGGMTVAILEGHQWVNRESSNPMGDDDKNNLVSRSQKLEYCNDIS